MSPFFLMSHLDVRKKGLIFVHNPRISCQSMHLSCDKPLSMHFLLSVYTMLPKFNFTVHIIGVGQETLTHDSDRRLYLLGVAQRQVT